jgi:hypothetical protein
MDMALEMLPVVGLNAEMDMTLEMLPVSGPNAEMDFAFEAASIWTVCRDENGS